MLREGDRGSDAHAGTSFERDWILDSVQTGFPSKPKIPIQGNPQAGLKVVAEMPFKGSNRLLRERLNPWVINIVGEER